MCQSSVLPLTKVATTLNNGQGNGYALWQFRVLPERIWMRTSIQDQFLFLQPVYGFLSWHLGRYVRWRILHQQVILLGRYRTGKRVLEKDIGQLGGKMQYARQKSIGGLRMSSVFHLYTTLPSTVSLMSGELPMQEKRGLLSPATKALPKPGYKMSIAHANAQALCPLFSCILWKVGRFSLPVNNSKTLLYVFVSRYHTTCYHKDRQ